MNRADSRARNGRTPWLLVAGGLALATTLSLPSRADDGAEKVDGVRATMERYFEVRELISRERQDWTLSRQLLADRIDLVQREIEQLRNSIAKSRSDIASTEAERTTLGKKNDELKATAAALIETITALEKQTMELLPNLPAPLLETVRPRSQLLPEDPSATKLTLPERFLSVLGILNETNKFNRDITLSTERRPVAGGDTVEVTVMYVGLAQAYYASKRGDVAGYGVPGPEGWVWTPANEHAPSIAQAIKIIEGEQEAVFVPLPIRID